jgi:diphosphate-dependent phosphofructokinase
VGVLIGELNELLADGGDGSAAGVAPRLSPPSRAVFEMFPPALQAELLQERDPHGNVQVWVPAEAQHEACFH